MALFITASAGLKASLDGEADDRKAKVEIKFNEVNWVDITEFVESIEIASSLESFSGFATTNTASVNLRNPKLADGTRPFSSNHYAVYDPLIYRFNGIKQVDGYGNLRANREIRISATSGAWEYIYIFTGYIDRAGFQEQEEGVIDQVKIGCLDGAKKLIETPCLTAGGDEISYVGFKVCDSTAPGASLVHAIALLGGIAAVDVIEDNITGHTCDYVRLTGNVWQELSKIAEAYLAYLYFDGSGKLCFVGSKFADAYVEPNPPASEWDFDKDNLIKIQKDHTEVVANHVKVQHKAYEIAVNKEIIYKFVDENTWDGEKNAYNIPLGDNVLPWTDPTVNHFLEFATPGGEKIELAYDIDAVGAILVQSTLGNITVAAYTVYANKVLLRLQNLVANDWLEKVEVEGKPIRNTKIFNITEIDAPSIALYGEKSKEVENKYFSSDVQAQTVCAWQRDLGAHPRQTFTLTVPALLHCQTGAWVKITLTDTGIGGAEDVYCRLDKYVHQFTKKRKAVTEISLLALIYDWVDSSAATPGLITPNTPQNAIVPSILLHPTYIEVQSGYNQGGGTTTPSQVVVSRTEGHFKAIAIWWDRQLNLTNFSHYEAQVSADKVNAYALPAPGSGDWKGALDGLTIKLGEFLVQDNIPPIGPVEDPKGRRLYYHIRRITTEGGVPGTGAWSAWVSATTLTVDTGDFARESILAEHLEVGAIKARELSFGADVNSIPVYEDADPASPAAEIFDLSQPDCVGSRGTIPAAGKEVVYAPPTAIDEVLREFRGFHSPRMIGQSEAIFQTAINLVKRPEDLSDTTIWLNAGAPDQILTDQYVDGKRLTKIQNTGAALDYVHQIYTTAFTQAQIGGSVICRKGNTLGNQARFVAYDNTGAAEIFKLSIDFDNYPNAPGIPSSGTLHNYTWKDKDTVEFQWIGTLAAAGNDCQLRCFASNNAIDDDYTYWTAVQLEDLPYPTPYIDQYRYPTGVRPAVSPNYAVTMPEKFVFKIKIRPWFVYDTGTLPRIAEWYVDANHRFIIYYSEGPDKFLCWWKNDAAGTTRVLDTEAFDDSGANDINQEIILYGQIDLSTQTGNNAFFAIVAGTKQAEDNDWDGALDAHSATLITLSIGHELAASHADSLIEYAKFWTWDGASLGTLADETDIDRVTADLTSLFDLTLEDYSLARYKPVSKQGAIGIFQTAKNLLDDPEDITTANWTAVTATIELSDFYIDGKRFTKLINTGAWGGAYQVLPAVTFTDGQEASSQALFIRGDETETRFELRDATAGVNRIGLKIQWDTRVVTALNGTLHDAVWINNDVLWISGISTAITAANVHWVQLRNATNGKYCYMTAVMAEDTVYPTPYTPTERAKDGVLNYPFPMPEKFSICFWVRPWFKYDTNVYGRFIVWQIDGTHRFIIAYNAGSDKIYIQWRDGTNFRYLYSQQFDDGSAHDDINQEIFVAAAIDLSAQSVTASRLKVYADSIGGDTTWDAAPDAKSSAFPALSIGQEDGDSEADSFISDLMILPNILLTEEQMDRHYNTRRPWYSLSEVASFDRQVRIDRKGIRLHNSELNITDWRNRQILISNRDGLMAKDAAGKIIHDIPDAPILTDMLFSGHLLFRTSGNYIDSLIQGETDVETARNVTGNIRNVDLSSYDGGIKNIRGALLAVRTDVNLHSGKTLATTYVITNAMFSLIYNTKGLSYSNFTRSLEYSVGVGLVLYSDRTTQVVVPITYNAGIPYLTWHMNTSFFLMADGNDTYNTQVTIYLQGLLV